jgi:hypothetical protein
VKKLPIIAAMASCFWSILLTSAPTVKADALDQWASNSLPHAGYQGWELSGVCFGNGRYVAVGQNVEDDTGELLTSDDGVKWTSITTNLSGDLPPFLDLFDVTFGGGLFVAVGWDAYGGGNINISADGTNWFRGPSQHFNSNLRRVTYGVVTGLLPPGSPGYGVFVALGDGAPIYGSGAAPGYNILMSDDGGQTWWETMAPGDSTLSDVAGGAGRFVAVDLSHNLFTSDDGYTWTKSTTGAPSGSVSFCNGQFFIPAGVGTNLVSTNGLTWSISTNDAPVALGRIIYNRGHYVATSGNTLLSSINGTNWIQHTLPTPTNYLYWSGFSDLAMGPTNIVTVGFYLTGGPYGVPLALVSGSFLDMSAAGPGQINLSGLLGSSYRIESIDNLGGTNQWHTADTFQLNASPFLWTDPEPADQPSRFYRAVLFP